MTIAPVAARRTWQAALEVGAGVLVALAPVSHAVLAAGQQARDGAALYAQACSACHARDGRGAPRDLVGFETPLPDFTDCSFASREADADWLAVAHAGGPARGFSRTMPAFGEALTGEELEAVVGHLRRFCRAPEWPRGELNLPRTFFTEKAFPEDETVLTTGVTTGDRSSLTNTFVYERRIGARSQWEAVVPIAAHERDGGSWAGGIGDVALGFKHALAHSLARGSIVSAAAEVVLPTGDERRGLGKGVAVFEPFVSYGQVLPGETFVQFQGGMEVPFNRARAEPEAFWRTAVGRSISEGRFGRTWSPMVELLGARELARGEPALWDVVPQVQVTLSTRQHVMANVGLRLPLNESSSRARQLVFYLLWDWFDGGFFEGW